MPESARCAAVVGIAGLGVMGSAISRLLIASGAQVRGYDTDGAARERHRAVGGLVTRSPAELAAACPVVLTSLPSGSALREVVSGPNGLRAGLAGAGEPGSGVPAAGRARAGEPGVGLVVELSTLSLADKEQARQALAAVNVALADAPLSGTGAQARTGDLVAFVSADTASARAAAVDVLRQFTRAQYDVGAFGNGSKYKFVANLLVAVHNVAAAEALVMAERAGLDLGTVLTAVADGAGSSRMLQVRGPLMVDRSYADATMRLEVFLKDVRLIGAFADSVGASAPLLAASRDVYLAALAGGRSRQDTACVAEVLREATPGGRA
jgi:3-hydroxyisobutyrate dehydrogenase-like beta-hydroxyacid dehydrogenase